MKRRQEISTLPDFPEVSFELRYRKRACDKLGIIGVYLYGGTRHSSVRTLRKYRSPEKIKRAAMHTTNKAFERYFQIEADDVRNIYRDTVVTFPPDNADKELTRKKVT